MTTNIDFFSQKYNDVAVNSTETPLKRKDNRGRPRKVVTEEVIVKGKPGRISKDIKFEKEQNELLYQILKILDITNEKPLFYLDEVDEAKEQQILSLTTDIKKYYNASHWSYFATKNKPILSLLKTLWRSKKININMIYEKDYGNININKKGMRLTNVPGKL